MKNWCLLLVLLILLSMCGGAKATEEVNPSRTPNHLSPTLPSPDQNQGISETATPFSSNSTGQPGREIHTNLKIQFQTNGVIYGLIWSPDGSVLASSGYGQINLWDCKNEALANKLTLDEGIVWDIE